MRPFASRKPVIRPRITPAGWLAMTSTGIGAEHRWPCRPMHLSNSKTNFRDLAT
jgi:hypothetical protein